MTVDAPDARCTGAILAGGANTRFQGRPKGLAKVGDRSIIERVADALRAAVDDIVLVANASDANAWLEGVRVVRDVRMERGSLVGVHTALASAENGVLVVAWDMPFLSSELLIALRREGEAHSCAVVPVSAHGPEPLCAYYPRSALDIASQLLDAGDMRLSRFVDALPYVRRFDVGQLSAFGDLDRMFFNVNDAATLSRAQAMASDDARPSRSPRER